MDVCAVFHVVLSRKKKGAEGGCGWPGKVPRSPAAHKKEKEEKADRKTSTVKRERLLKKKTTGGVFLFLNGL
jgi:hypothetical protein